ncbi:hypothetical protein V2J09_020252 [Rumex salicifolius]
MVSIVKNMDVKSLMFILMNLLVLGACKSNNEPLDKSVVKVIKTERGDIYDFYKQPSLQHPSLENHNFHPQMRPTSSPKRMRKGSFPRQVQELDVSLKDGGCPLGTVPIRRIERDELTHFNIMNNNLSSSRAEPNSVYRQPGTIPGSKAFNGVGAFITVYNPHVGPDEYSSAQITIQDGSDMIEVGWTVNPIMYKDNVTRLFVYSVVGNTHCFNSQCGFVIVNPEIPLDMELSPVSVEGHNVKTEAFCQRFVVVNDAHKMVQATGTQEFSNHKDYTVYDNPRALRPEHFVFFGGLVWSI